jgi:DNA-binding CsgD family transcriptional regulator
MPRFTAADTRALQDLKGELGTLVDGGPPARTWVASALRDALGAQKGLVHRYFERGAGLGVEGVAAGVPPAFLTYVDNWLSDKTVGWTAYNPIRPEPVQRNVAMTLTDVQRLTGITSAPILSIYSKFGIGNDDQLRVLVSEGSSLLAWVGVFQDEPIAPRQRRMLQHLVPALQRRFATERVLSTAPLAQRLLLAALEEIASPAFVLSEAGVVLEANALGRAWLEKDSARKRASLHDAMRPRSRRSDGFRVTRVASAGTAVRHLVIRKAEAGGLVHASVIAARWGFTPRETQVLTLIVEGLTNRTIAAELAVSERTVEAHLTRMFEKAQVESRAQLMVRVTRGA